ncbi:MAG: translocation/assembly module TamB domain-containing protein [Cyanobacteria bacterium]|nr:translocation/assembly module TamB domain-containing protein [Cyanobacteriota bacterium]
MNPEPTPTPRRNTFWKRAALPLGVLTIAGIGGTLWATKYVYEDIVPIVETSLEKEINRPVKLGKVQGFSLGSLRLGKSEIPATATDSDHVEIEAIEVNFNLWESLQKKKLKIKLDLLNPVAFIEEDKPGVWIGTEITPQKEDDPNAGDVDVAEVKLSNTTVELLPIAKEKQPRRSVKYQKVTTTVQVFDRGKQLKINSEGESAVQGTFKVNAEVWNRTINAKADAEPTTDKLTDKPIAGKPATLRLDINGEVRTEKMLLSEFDRLARLPVNVESGELNSNLTLQIRADEKYPSLKGTATFRDISGKVPGVAYGVSKVEGDLRFEGRQIVLEKSKAVVAKEITVQTTGKIDFEKGLDLTSKTGSIEIPKLLKTFDIKTPGPIAGAILSEVKITGPIETPRISGQIKNTKVIAIAAPESDKPQPDIRLTSLQTRFTIDSKSKKLGITDLSVLPELGGSITGTGTIALAKPESINLQLQATGFDGDKISKLYNGGAALPVAIGSLAASITISGSPTNPKTLVAWNAPGAKYPASGEIAIVGESITLRNTIAQVEGGTARINGTVVNGLLALNVKTDGIPLKPFSPELRGNFSGDLNVTGTIATLSAETVRVSGSTQLSEGVAIITDPIVAQIEWTGKQLNIKEATAPGLSVNGSIFASLGEKPEVTGLDLNVKTEGLALASLPTQLPKDVRLSGTTDFDGNVTGTPTSPMVRGNLALNALQVNDLKFDSLRGTVSFTSNQGVDLNLAGRRDRISAKLDRDFQPISVNLQRGDGTIDAVRSGQGFNVAMRRLDLAELNGFGLEKPLTQLLAQTGAADEIGSPTLGGQLNGNLSLNLKSQQLQAGNIQIDRLRLGNFRAASLTAVLNNASAQSLASANVVMLQPELNSKFNAQSIRANIQNVNLASGAISGATIEVNAPQAIGFTALQIQANLGGGNLKTGQNGTVSVIQPKVGLGQADDFKAAFFVSSTQFNLQKSTLRLPLVDDRGRRTGEVGTVALRGNVNFQGDPKIEAELNVLDGQFQDVLRTAQLFQISDLTRGTTLPLYASAADVQPSSIGDVKAPVVQQLKRFAEINQIIAQTAQTRSNTLLPTALDIRGRFNGTIKVAGSLSRPDRLTASFKLAAKTLEWRPYASYLNTTDENKLEINPNRVLKAENAVLEGGIENGVLSIRPFLLQSGATTIRLSSVQIGEVEEQSGQLKVENLPIESIQSFFPYPLNIGGQPIALAGNLNGTVSLSGPRNKPNFIGAVDLTNGTLNDQPLQSAVGAFNYEDGRLKFQNTIVANSSEPIKIVGELPYDLDLPTGKIVSADRSLKVTGRVKDEGLSLLNLLGQPIAWEGGKGQLNFDISSAPSQPLKVQGELILDGAKIKAQALPEALNNVRGRVFADFTGVHVENLRGEFSRGQVVANGSIPVFGFTPPELPEEPVVQKDAAGNAIVPLIAAAPVAPAGPRKNQPLIVDLQRLAINLKGLYEGGVNGRMVIGGSALNPKIGGNVTLTDGRILLSDPIPENVAPGSKSNGRSAFELKNLKLRLGDNIRVVRAPLLNFVAKGNLDVTGTLDKLQPSGRIDLESGQVNLFTTQFVLARGYRNFAEFRPELGLDPNLNVRLTTAVPEVTRTRIPTNNVSSEITQSLNLAGNVGGVQTVRIQARVEGPASLLTQNLELKSSPSRSRTEIVSLLGGGFVNTLGRGDGATLGIANFAGSALLTNVQGVIGNAIGLSEFRLFPTLIGNGTTGTSTFGLAAEAGVDILRTADGVPIVSATALRVLTANQATQFGLRYRINEQLIFRGSTDFTGDNRAVFEFETRF